MFIRELNKSDMESVLSAYREVNDSTHDFGYDKFSGAYFLKLLENMSYESFLTTLEESKKVPETEEDSVQTVYGGFDEEGNLVGFVTIRWNNNEKVMTYQGNVGALVIPSQRGHGYAQQMFELASQELFDAGYPYVYVSYKAKNVPSMKTLLNSGTVIDHTYTSPAGEEYVVCKYSLELKEHHRQK